MVSCYIYDLNDSTQCLVLSFEEEERPNDDSLSKGVGIWARGTLQVEKTLDNTVHFILVYSGA